jgi:hypothetical protein
MFIECRSRLEVNTSEIEEIDDHGEMAGRIFGAK